MKKVLLIDDEKNFHYSFKRVFKNLEVTSALSAEEGLEILRAGEEFSLIISDIKMPGLSGLELLEILKEEQSETPVIIITAHGNLENAIQAVQNGAYDYLIKPFDFQKLKAVIFHALEISNETKTQKDNNQDQKVQFLIGNSQAMQNIYREIARVALRDVTVLITGESGTGKEQVAKAIHHYSERKNNAFVGVNCGAIPSDLMESELFGYEKGAFTGAHKRTAGKFELANGGTLFLDEIGELPLNLQVKILRAIQEREITPLGANRPVQVNVRIIAATNRNLKQEMQNGNFREDLYYRLHVFPIQLPPLKERKEDILPLSLHFIEKINTHHKMNLKGLSEVAVDRLNGYHFPGNVRELENIITRAALNAHSDIIEAGDVDLESSDEMFLSRMERNLENIIQLLMDKEVPVHQLVEKIMLTTVLRAYDFNQSKAADYLGINRNTLRKKLKEHQIL